ncbi:MAG: xanthine dehydrogenase family protein molybdopterin-binding subunit [Chloroflexi bacterium]|nr:xanthine dehydrogenase family protein molybdopterin-binding subunit [Chloroflexota bacterium]
MVTTAKPYKVIGTRPVRPDGADKVTGRAEYGADVRFPRLAYGRVKRSPHAHAIIKSIDVSKAEALPGVLAVVTAKDMPDPGERIVPTMRGLTPLKWIRGFILARDKVLYHGHPIAAVCATDPHIAEDALDLIEIEYEVLEHVLDVQEAMTDAAPILHPGMRTEHLLTPVMGAAGEVANDKPTNIAKHLELSIGDVAAGFAQAEVIVEGDFGTVMAHQGYIEPHVSTAQWQRDGQLVIWTSSQGAFALRDATAEMLELPVSQVKVIPTEIGGGFGGKTKLYLEPVAALLAKKAQRPVRVSMSRMETMEASGPTSGTHLRAKIGAMRDGTIVAIEGHFAYEAGAYPGSPYAAGARCAFGPYNIPNQYVEAWDVVLNKPVVAAYRAPGAPASEFAVESLIDELAQRLEMDPMDLRLKNSAVEGSRRVDGAAFGVIGAVEVMEAVKQSDHYRSELQGENRGRGVAVGFWFNGGNESAAYSNVNADGTVSLVVGSVDIGGQRAALAMTHAESLGLTYEDVMPGIADTDSIGWTGTTGGSRTTFATGWAAHDAALDIRAQMEERAAQIWDVETDQVAYGDDAIIRGPAASDGSERSFTFKELAGQLSATGGMIQGKASVKPTTVGPTFAANIVDIEVDPETGKVDVLRYTAIQDVGTAIHPSYVEGQIQGGVVQGIGMALSEEYIFDATGRMENSSLLDYRMPTALDVPMIDTVLIEVPNPGHPYGVRGVGEVPIIPPLAAVANAIQDAIGVRMHHLPASPPAILAELYPDEA